MQQAIHVLIDHAHLGRMDEVARQLAARGFTLHATFDAIGVLAGTAEVVDLDGLAGVPGRAEHRERASQLWPEPAGHAAMTGPRGSTIRSHREGARH
jgi:hypothetical protein